MQKRNSTTRGFTILRRSSGFTIVELLVVIVVIGILAAITIVAYNGIAQKATIASLQSDLDNASKQLKLFQVTDPNGNYPTANNCPSPGATEICLKSSTGNSFTGGYTVNNASNPKTFSLDVTNTNGTKYRITNDTGSVAVAGLNCPTGFIPVPGSATYGTSDFCVMKYEAKNAGGNVPVSQAAGNPWVDVSQTDGINYSPNVVGCTGCHLITEAEWLTIAQNVLGVVSNWSGGSVGSGYIYSGHNDSAPSSPLAADTNDSNGYYGETNTGGNQRRTLTLSNGSVIWDLAGNVIEYTSGQTTGGQPGIVGNGLSWREWTAITSAGTVSPNPSPATTGISGASSWNSSNGIGQILSNADSALITHFRRGGSWGSGSIAGVLEVDTSYNSGMQATNTFGFRVAR